MELTHIRLMASDFAASCAFYRDTLGLKEGMNDGENYAEYLLGGDRYLGIFPRTLMAEAIGTTTLPADAPAQDRFALIVRVEDPDEVGARLAAAGIPVAAFGTDRPDWDLRTFHVRDPDGNLIELYAGLTDTTA